MLLNLQIQNPIKIIFVCENQMRRRQKDYKHKLEMKKLMNYILKIQARK